MGRALEQFGLEWIEEPLDATTRGPRPAGRRPGHPDRHREMLTSVAEHAELLRLRSVDYLQPDAPRSADHALLELLALAEHAGVSLAPHFAMEIHVHLSAAYPHTSWVEHFEWLEPLWNERLELRAGRMVVPPRPGLGLSLSEQAHAWTTGTSTFGRA